MAGEFSAEGGGVHPGKPIIWPTSRPATASPEAQTTGGVRGVPSKAAPVRPGEVAPTEVTAPSVPAAPAKPAPSITRPLTVEDVRAHLLNIQVEPNDFNTKLASLMLRKWG